MTFHALLVLYLFFFFFFFSSISLSPLISIYLSISFFLSFFLSFSISLSSFPSFSSLILTLPLATPRRPSWPLQPPPQRLSLPRLTASQIAYRMQLLQLLNPSLLPLLLLMMMMMMTTMMMMMMMMMMMTLYPRPLPSPTSLLPSYSPSVVLDDIVRSLPFQ